MRDPLRVWLAAGPGFALVVTWIVFASMGGGFLPWLLLAAGGWLLSLAFLCRYVVTQTHLVVWAGFFPTTVDKATISRVLPSRSFVAHACLSTDQVIVLYLVDGVFRHVLVSPEPRQEFLDALKEGTGLVKEALTGLGPPPSSPLLGG